MHPARALLVLLALVPGLAAESGGSSVARYGSGTSGAGGFVPECWVSSGPYLGNQSFGLSVENGVGGAPALIAFSGAPASLPVFDFTLLVDPTSPLFTVAYAGVLGGTKGKPGDGSLVVPLPLPNNAALLGAALHSQWLVFDSATKSGLAASNGLRTTFIQGPLVVAGGNRVLVDYVPGNRQARTNTYATSANDVQISDNGRYAFVTGASRFDVYDLNQSSPVRVAGTTFSKQTNSLAVHPNQQRAYVLLVSKTAPEIAIVDIRPASPKFGQQIGSVAKLPSTGLADMEGVSISADGTVLAVAVMGLVGTRSLVIVDVDPGSATTDTFRKQIPVSLSGFLTDVDLSANGAMAYVCLAQLGPGSTLARILVGTGTVLNKVSINADFATDIDIDPRGRFAITACPNSNNLAVLDLRPGTNYFSVRLLPAVSNARFFSVALTPDATTAVTISNGSAGIYGFDVATGNIMYKVAAPTGAAIAAR